MKNFPLFIDISKYKIVVIGGGIIASRRVRTLLSFATDITVVAPKLCDAMINFYQNTQITWVKDFYHSSQIYGADMVLAMTNDKEVNHQIQQDCRELERTQNKKVLVSVADEKNLCDFYFPSIIEDGNLIIAVNSGGTSPSLVKKTRKKLEHLLQSSSLYHKD
ncbi:MAG: bifunctional precorrin-2 dehydrogenase/sirohydrochlorin ferrochelatase [Schaedlerella sp.]|nr:bifunctional precorrin-2 dehydrogenase/sirohydrochlorin ferrochelatase [Schaedlerella sp.]